MTTHLLKLCMTTSGRVFDPATDTVVFVYMYVGKQQIICQTYMYVINFLKLWDTNAEWHPLILREDLTLETLQSLVVKPDSRSAGLSHLRDLLQVVGNSNFG